MVRGDRNRRARAIHGSADRGGSIHRLPPQPPGTISSYRRGPGASHEARLGICLIPVNREWLEKLQAACGEQVYRFIERRPAASDPGREWADDLFDDDKGVEDSDTFATLIDEGFEPERVRLVMETDDEMQGPGGVFLRWSGLNLGVPADVREGFERMWEALGLDDELDAWLSDTVNESDGDAPRE
nr:hypothetical protein [Corynebacterium auriscanis]